MDFHSVMETFAEAWVAANTHTPLTVAAEQGLINGPANHNASSHNTQNNQNQEQPVLTVLQEPAKQQIESPTKQQTESIPVSESKSPEKQNSDPSNDCSSTPENIKSLKIQEVHGKCLPVHCIIEQIPGPQACGQYVELDSYAIVPSDTLFGDLVRTALGKLGYSGAQILGAKGSIQIKKWKPLAFDQITENSEATVGDILGDLTTMASLHVRLYSVPDNPQEWKDITVRNAVLELLREMSQIKLAKLCPLSQPMLSNIINNRYMGKIGKEKCQEFGQWYLTYRKQHPEAPTPEVVPSDKPADGRLTFHPTKELPIMRDWFHSCRNPSRRTLQMYVDILNQGPVRQQESNTYSIVEFEDGSIELVPRTWLHGKRCFWPPSTVNVVKISQWVKKMMPPQRGWTLYPVKIVGETENYEHGRKKAADIFELSLDLNSYKRLMKKRKVEEDEDFDISLEANNLGSSAESNENSLDMFPPPKRRDSEKNSVISSKDIEIGSSLFDSEEDSRDSSVSQRSSKVQDQDPNSHVNSSDSRTHRSQSSQTSPEACDKSTHLDVHSSGYQGNHSKDESSDFYKMILEELKLIKRRQEQQEQLLHQILEKMDSNGKSASNSMPTKPFAHKLPVDTYSEMQELNSSLSDKELKAELTIRLQSLGGNDYKDHTRRALRHVMSDNVAELYTWVGSKDKHRFCAMVVSDVIIDAVADENTTTRNTVEDVIKGWLRHAKDRNTAKNGK